LNVTSRHGAYIHDITAGGRVTLGGLHNSSMTTFGRGGADREQQRHSTAIERLLRNLLGRAAPDEVAIHLINSDGVRIKSNILSTNGDPGVVGILWTLRPTGTSSRKTAGLTE
jgi:hypothetical protein